MVLQAHSLSNDSHSLTNNQQPTTSTRIAAPAWQCDVIVHVLHGFANALFSYS